MTRIRAPKHNGWHIKPEQAECPTCGIIAPEAMRQPQVDNTVNRQLL